jgi:hypothetical protein
MVLRFFSILSISSKLYFEVKDAEGLIPGAEETGIVFCGKKVIMRYQQDD